MSIFIGSTFVSGRTLPKRKRETFFDFPQPVANLLDPPSQTLQFLQFKIRCGGVRHSLLNSKRSAKGIDEGTNVKWCYW